MDELRGFSLRFLDKNTLNVADSEDIFIHGESLAISFERNEVSVAIDTAKLFSVPRLD